jgi:hypothetical protein
MPGLLLDGARRCAPHRQVRAEAVAKDVDADGRQAGPPRGPSYQSLDVALRQRSAILPAQHPRSSQVPMIA